MLLFWALVPYFLLMAVIRTGIRRCAKAQDDKSVDSIRFTVIVPAHNEADSLNQTIDALLKQDYSNHLYEIIIVDDRSQDSTPDILRAYGFQIRTVRIDTAPVAAKKHAISTGIQHARYEMIAITDADCTVSTTWLSALAKYYREGADVVPGPVLMRDRNTLFSRLIALDFLSLISFGAGLIGISMPMICNGANFSYRRQAFFDVNGFDKIDHVSSGDDDLLLQKFARAKKRIRYAWNSDALVSTDGPQSISAFVRQRIRWGSKGAGYADKRLRWLLIYVFFAHLFLMTGAISAVLYPSYLPAFLLALFLKALVEWPVVIQVTTLTNQQYLRSYYPLLQIFQIPYIVIFGLLANLSRKKW